MAQCALQVPSRDATGLLVAIAVKKRPFLLPLAASVAVLLGGPMVPAQVSSASVVMVPEASAQAVTVDHLVLTRSAAGGVQLADHWSHSSHASHSSHSSHMSGN